MACCSRPGAARSACDAPQATGLITPTHGLPLVGSDVGFRHAVLSKDTTSLRMVERLRRKRFGSVLRMALRLHGIVA